MKGEFVVLGIAILFMSLIPSLMGYWVIAKERKQGTRTPTALMLSCSGMLLAINGMTVAFFGANSAMILILIWVDFLSILFLFMLVGMAMGFKNKFDRLKNTLQPNEEIVP